MDFTKIGARVSTIIFAAFIVGVLAIASFLDVKVADTLYLGENIFSAFIECIGKMPAFGIAGTASLVLFRTVGNKNSNPSWKWILRVAYVIFAVAFFTIAFKDICDILFDGKMVLIACFALGFLLTGLLLVPFFKVRSEVFEKYRKWAITSIIAVCLIALIVLIIKNIWGRERYLDSLESGAVPKIWFIPQRIEGAESMPSGHTAMATTVFLLMPLCQINKNLIGKQVFLFVSFSVFILFVALARITGGAHYLSDTAVAIAISFIVCILMDRFTFGKNGNKIYFSEKNFLNKLL